MGNNKTDIALIHIDRWSSSNSGLAILEPVLRRSGLTCLQINASELDKYIDITDVFGFSVFDHTYPIAQGLTQRLLDKKVIWGGWTPTALPEFVLEYNPAVDFVILEEGEKRLPSLLKSFRDPSLFDSIDGIAYRDTSGRIQVRRPRTNVDMNALPLPNELSILNDIVFVELSRGCYGQCHYCQESYKMRFKNASRVVEEIQQWYDRGKDRFYIGNANSLANGPLLHEVIDELEGKQLAVELSLVGRPNDVIRNRDVLERVFKSPNLRLGFVEIGVEANTQNALDLLGRRSTPEINRKAITHLLKLRDTYSPGTEVMANMILFSHFDMTLEDFIANVCFIGEFGCSRDVTTLRLCGLANTPIWDAMKERGFVPDPAWGLQIANYRFTDDVVDQLFRKFTAHFRSMLTIPNGTGLELSSVAAAKRWAHDKVVEFYFSGDILGSIKAFVEGVAL